MKVYDPFEKMTQEQKLHFVYTDLISRNLVDEKVAENDFKKDLEKLKKNKIKNDKQIYYDICILNEN